MKILHVCLAAFYIDDFGYQENILPKIHKLQGHKVEIVASTETYLDNKRLGYVKAKAYKTADDIQITRIPYVKWLPHFIAKKVRLYIGLNDILNKFKPDIIFLHNFQFVSVLDIIKYAKTNTKTVIYADSHTDFINSSKNWISKYLLNAIIYKWCAKKIIPYVKKFYGTLPSRVDFLSNVYHVPNNKLDLLVFGVDDSIVNINQKTEIRKNIRKSLNLRNEDFIIISGGKLDKRKNIHLLMKAINEIENKNIKLIVFGMPTNQMKNEIKQLSKGKNIIYLGWLSPIKIYNYLFAADLAFFPGTHSVLWEQAVGVGLPTVFKKWDGIQHVDIGGNCLFLDDVNVKTIKNTINKLYYDKQLFYNMKNIAVKNGIKYFSYFEIAKKAIEQ